MPSTTVAIGTFPSRKAAHQAIRRLVSDGFARNSIEIVPHDDDEGCDLEVHVRKENLRRARRLIHASEPLYAVRQSAMGAMQTARAHPIMILGAGILAGFAIYNLLPRNGSMSSRFDRRR